MNMIPPLSYDSYRQTNLMKKSVLAILWHYTDYKDPKEKHKFCPRTDDSWCNYWAKGKEASSKNIFKKMKRKIKK
jgi:hypothetical protein